MSKRKRNQNKCCETCDNLVAIGEGDHICYECGAMPIMPICEYQPTEDYFKCGGKRWEE